MRPAAGGLLACQAPEVEGCLKAMREQIAARMGHEANTPLQYIGDSLVFLQSAFDDLLVVCLGLRECVAEALAKDPEATAARRAGAVLEAADLAYLNERVPQALQRALDGVEAIRDTVRSLQDAPDPGGSV